MDILFYVLSFVTGLVIGSLAIRQLLISREKKQMAGQHELEKDRSVLEEKLRMVENESQQRQQQLDNERSVNKELSGNLVKSEMELKNLGEKLENQKKDILSMQEKFAKDFEIISSRLLRQSSDEVTQLQRKQLQHIIDPLRQKLTDFEKKVEDTYEKGMKDRTDLRTELRMLADLNKRISEEARHLTNALKTDTKNMGNWGELILERILEQSGLVKGLEYQTQFTDRTLDGALIRPDVIVKLPDEKHLIVDSKVSLVAYDNYINEEDEEIRKRSLKSHIESIREHIKGLSDKNYQSAASLDSPDFVLLFMPLESAFSLALQTDNELFNFAWERKIVIVSPTTLLATLRTVASLWKHEKQTKNAMEIARQGGALVDKFYSFLKDLENIGRQIGTLQNSYQEAHKKLYEGKGNLIRRSEKLRELGVKTEKSLPGSFHKDDDENE